MRYILLQQVGGPAWMVYDSERSIEVKTFHDRYARDVASELCTVLNRGSEALIEADKAVNSVPSVRANVQPSANGRRVLQRKMSSEGKEV